MKSLTFLSHLVHWKSYAIVFCQLWNNILGFELRSARIVCIKLIPSVKKVLFLNQLNRVSWSNVHKWLHIDPTEHSKHFWSLYVFKPTLPCLYSVERNHIKYPYDNYYSTRLSWTETKQWLYPTLIIPTTASKPDSIKKCNSLIYLYFQGYLPIKGVLFL